MSMRHRVVGVLLVLSVAASCSSTMTKLDDDSCRDDRDRRKHKLRFEVKPNGCVAAVLKEDGSPGETIRVHRCDVVRWNFLSLNKKSIVFDSASGSPLLWADSKFQYTDIKSVVSADARDGEYAYVVKTQGVDCSHDPMIIVQP